MLYEFHVYEAMPGKLAALNERFANHALGFFNKHNMGVVGFWTDDIGTSNVLTYILSVESLAHSESKWKEFSSDPEWRQVLEESERESTLIARTQTSFMALTPYSSEPNVSFPVQELRVYDAVPGKLPALHDRFANHTISLFEKHGMEIGAFWTEVTATPNQLVYMLGYPSLADREKSWAAFLADADWWSTYRESEKDGPVVVRTNSRILRPTGYSPR